MIATHKQLVKGLVEGVTLEVRVHLRTEDAQASALIARNYEWNDSEEQT